MSGKEINDEKLTLKTQTQLLICFQLVKKNLKVSLAEISIRI